MMALPLPPSTPSLPGIILPGCFFFPRPKTLPAAALPPALTIDPPIAFAPAPSNAGNAISYISLERHRNT